jgi:hypothetical protein
MFKKLNTATFVLALALPVAAFAQNSMDTDADGLVSADEFAAAYPDASPEAFAQIDINADGALDDTEIAAAREAGVLPDA